MVPDSNSVNFVALPPKHQTGFRSSGDLGASGLEARVLGLRDLIKAPTRGQVRSLGFGCWGLGFRAQGLGSGACASGSVA